MVEFFDVHLHHQILGSIVIIKKNLFLSFTIIDEFDRSLHPQLTRKFIKDFGSLRPELRRQLIITTHEARLMELEALRRDEIWFTEKNNGITDLYSLEEFKERKDRRIGKAYEEGRYGGLPSFRMIYPDPE